MTAEHELPTLPIEAVNDGAQPSGALFSVELERDILEVYPASSASLAIVMRNTGSDPLRYRVSATGLPEAWLRLRHGEGIVQGGDAAFARLVVSPSHRPESPPSDFACAVHVSAPNLPAIERRFTLRLRGFAGLAVDLLHGDSDDGGDIALLLHNLGNEDLSLRIGVHDPSNTVDIRLRQESLTLAADERRQIQGRIFARRRPLAGGPQRRDFALLVQAEHIGDWRIPLPASLSIQPRMSRRAAVSLCLLLLAVAMGALAMIATLAEQPPPTIHMFQLSADQIAQGEPVTLSWDADYAERFLVEADGATVATLTGEATSFVWRSDESAGNVTLALVAVAGETSVRATLELVAHAPLAIVEFAAQPTVLHRHVASDIRVSWRVTGASAVELQFPPELALISDAGQDETGREMVLTGAAAADVALRLSAVHALDGVTEEGLTVPVIDAECAPLVDAALYALPESDAEQMAMAIKDVPTLADGIDHTRGWLRIELATGETGWGRLGDFKCAGFDILALRMIKAAEINADETSG